MQLEELFAPEPDETSGEIILRGPMNATLSMPGAQQQQLQLPKGTVVRLIKKLPQKRLVMFSIDGKRYVTTDEDWQAGVGL